MKTFYNCFILIDFLYNAVFFYFMHFKYFEERSINFHYTGTYASLKVLKSQKRLAVDGPGKSVIILVTFLC